MSGISNQAEVSLTEAIESLIEKELLEIHTSMPAEVLSFDAGTQTVSVQLGFNRLYNGAEVVYPVLEKIPVVYPRSGKSGFYVPIAKGDSVLIVFAQRNLDTWLENGTNQLPKDGRKFDVNDAVAIPGLYKSSARIGTTKDAATVYGEKVFVGNPDDTLTDIEIDTPSTTGTATGKPVEVENASADLVAALINLAKLVDGAFYGIPPSGGSDTGGGGGVDALTSTALGKLIEDLEKLKA